MMMLSLTHGWTQSGNCLTDKEIDSLLSKLYRGVYFERQAYLLQGEIDAANDIIFHYQQLDSANILIIEQMEIDHKQYKKKKKKQPAIFVLAGLVAGMLIATVF